MPDVVVEVMPPSKASSPTKSAMPVAKPQSDNSGSSGGGAFFVTQIDDDGDDDDNANGGGFFITQTGSSKVKPVANAPSRKPRNVRGALNKMEDLSSGGQGETKTIKF